ncbi:MAG: hypothetical protein GF421_08055 [Candidatus Aminicenantes bacterium]|nr:hypothetical protein [Candidatus Aminicenantes bacterium]
MVDSPSSEDGVRSCLDYAEQVLSDRWDMNERTDLGWRIFNTVEEPRSFLTDISFSAGIFSASSVYTSGGGADYSDANIFLLDSAYLGSAKLGKVGENYPIQAGTYTHLVMRMSLGPDSAGPYGQLLWSKDTIYNGVTTSGSFLVYNGWRYYIIDIPSLGIASGSDSWSGLIDSLRLDPVNKKDQDIEIDWIRLVDYSASQERTITWSGNTGNVDIYLDDNSNSADGNLGVLAQNISGSSYTFLAGGLASGDYYVAITPTGTQSFSYSSGYYRVSSTPVVRLTKPSKEGSDQDYVTVCFSDPWDMNNTEDVEHTERVKNDQFTSIDYENLAGQSYSSQSVYYGESFSETPPAVGDPNVFFLHFLYRGDSCPIDTSRYHNLVFKMGIHGTQSVSEGSIARVMWRLNDETVENVSEDIVIRHLGDRWVMNKIVFDLNDIPLEQGSGSPSQSGWTGQADSFRIDPHEFTSSRAFFFDEVRITSDWSADNSFEIEWDLSDEDGSSNVSLYYDTDQTGFDGTLIASDLSCSTGADSYVWNTSGVSEGTYWIYAISDDGENQNQCYSGGPVNISHGLIPEISLSKTHIIFGAEKSGPDTSDEEILLTNSGEGSLNWQAEANDSWISVTPSSGTGEAILEIGVDAGSLSTGYYSGTVVVTDTEAWNSPQVIDVELTVYAAGSDSEPFGLFETPTEGETVSGNIPVTGWALDDIEVNQVEIKREPCASDPGEVIGPDGLVYIGDGVFVKGSRPDVESTYPEYPKADRAGWGYMMLTNFLPDQGNGEYTIHAIAHDGSGNQVVLGTKTITCDNDNRVKPFGTIDTPTQGGTASGSDYVNFGWALTPQPKSIPTDGSTIWVWVDGVPLGHPVYNNYRSDIATLFPDYANSDGAVGYYYLDTTAYENGAHSIAWSVVDSNGDEDGIGSRFFEIQNLAGDVSGGYDVNSLLAERSGRLQIGLEGLLRGMQSLLKKNEGGFVSDLEEISVQKTTPGGVKVFRVEIEELERIELHFNAEPGFDFIGWGSLSSRDLPIGSHLDQQEGIFTWMPVAGFLGEHVLHFAVTDGTFRGTSVRVVVHIKPKKYLR